MKKDIRYKGNGELIREATPKGSVSTIRASFDLSKDNLALTPPDLSSLSPDIAKVTIMASGHTDTFWIDEDHLEGKMHTSYINSNDVKADLSAGPSVSSIYTDRNFNSPTEMNAERASNLMYKTFMNSQALPSDGNPHKQAAADAISSIQRPSENAKKDNSETEPKQDANQKTESGFTINDKHQNAPSSLIHHKYTTSIKCAFDDASKTAGTICQNALYRTILLNDFSRGYRAASVYTGAILMPFQVVLAAASANAHKMMLQNIRHDLTKAGLIEHGSKNFDINRLAKNEKIDISKSIPELRKMLLGGNLSDKQTLLIQSAISLNESKTCLYSLRHAKRSMKRALRRSLRYANQDNETYRSIVRIRFSLSYQLSDIALKSALRLSAKSLKAAGTSIEKVGIKASKTVYNNNQTVKEAVDSIYAFKSKTQKRISASKAERAKRIEHYKRRTVSKARSGVKSAGIRILGKHGFDASIRTARTAAKLHTKVQKTRKAVSKAISAASTKVRAVINTVFASVRKYLIIPAIILCLLISMTSLFGGSIISFLSIMESGFLNVSGGNADTFDDSMLNTISTGTREFNRIFEKTLQNTTGLAADITHGVTENAIYEAVSGDIALVVSSCINVSNDVKQFINDTYGTDLPVGDTVSSDEIILYVDDYRISCVDENGNELPSLDLNNDPTLFSFASVFQQQDIGGENPLAWKNRAAYVDYALLLWCETHRFGVVTSDKGPCDHNGISWKEDHSFICKNGHWGRCEESGKYKNGTHDGKDEGAKHKRTYTTYDSETGEAHTHTYTVNCDGSDVYWECPGHIDIESKVVVGSLDPPTSTDDKMSLDQMEKDAWVFSMDYLGCNSVLGTAEYISSFDFNLLISARSFAMNKIATAFGWETMANDSADIFNHYKNNLDPKTIWKGWFDPETRQDNWEWVRLYYLAGEEVDKSGKKGWETIYGYTGLPYLIYSGATGGSGATVGNGNATKAEVLAAAKNYDLTSFQESLMNYACMAADKPVYYYWGGSPSSSDIGTVANFGRIVEADYKNRNRKGLDCSGFINWCYRSAGNDSFLRYTTSDMVSVFNDIRPEELSPGDVIVYNNSSGGHVKMFCGYDDGYYYFIESSGSAGKVIYSKCTSFSYMAKDLSSYR